MISNIVYNPPREEGYIPRTRHCFGRDKEQFKSRKIDGGPQTDRSRRSKSRRSQAIGLRADRDEKAKSQYLHKDDPDTQYGWDKRKDY